jgi:hypothetical protein
VSRLLDLFVEAVANTQPMIVAIRYGCVRTECATPKRCDARRYCCGEPRETTANSEPDDPKQKRRPPEDQ